MIAKLIASSASLVSLLSATIAHAGVVAQWNLNEGSGTTVSPAAGPVTGTFNGSVTWQTFAPTPASFAPTNGLLFGGTANDYVNFPDNAVLEPTPITVAFWARATDANHAGQTLLAKYDSFPGSWEFAFGTAGNFFFRTFNPADTFAGHTAADPFTATEFHDGRWHHFAGTHDGSLTKLYVDGVLIESLSNPGAINVNTHPMRMGQRSFAGAEAPYDGVMGGPLTIWDEALSVNQIAGLVPEPAAGGLLSLGALLFWRRGAKRK